MKKILHSYFKNMDSHDLDNETEITHPDLIITPKIKGKVLEVRQALDNNAGVIIYGNTFSAKSMILVLATQIKPGTEIEILNPKAMERGELFGTSDNSSTGWKDGLLSKIFKQFAITSSEGDQIILFDGPVDMGWIENFNTVLDVHKILSLESCESFYLTPSMKFVFEAGHLDKVSPATISRCSVVFIDSKCLSWKEIFLAWFNKIKIETWLENHDVLLKQLFEWILPPLLETVSKCKMAAPVASKNLVQCSLQLFEILLNEALPNLKERKYLRGWIQVGYLN